MITGPTKTELFSGAVGTGREQQARQTKSDEGGLYHQYTRAFGLM